MCLELALCSSSRSSLFSHENLKKFVLGGGDEAFVIIDKDFPVAASARVLLTAARLRSAAGDISTVLCAGWLRLMMICLD